MNINYKILLVTVVLVLATGIAVSQKRVWVENQQNQKADATQKPNPELSDETYVGLKIEELKKSVNKQEIYNYYKEYSGSIDRSVEVIAQMADKLSAEADNISAYSAECLGRIETIEASEDSYADKRKAADEVSNEDCFVLLQSSLERCESLKYELSELVKNSKTRDYAGIHKDVPKEAGSTEEKAANEEK